MFLFRSMHKASGCAATKAAGAWRGSEMIERVAAGGFAAASGLTAAPAWMPPGGADI